MILNEFFNLPQVFEKDMTEGAMSEIDLELRDIVAREDFDALYELFSANTPAGRYVQDMYDDVVIDAGLHPDDDFERIEQIVFDRLADDFGEQDMTEKRGDLRPKLGSARDRGKSIRKWRHNRGLDEQGVEEGIFNSKPNPVLPVVDKINKVARELTPQNVDAGKQIIQSHTRDITRMLSPQAKAGVDVIEQGVAEGPKEVLGLAKFAMGGGILGGQSPADIVGEQDVAEGAPVSGDGGAVDNFKQQMANNTELAYQKSQQGMAEGQAKIRKVVRELPSGGKSETYELLNDKGVTLKTGMSKETAQSALKAHRQKTLGENRLALLKQIIQS